MAPKVGSTPNNFVNIYSDEFAMGRMDFDVMSTFFLDSLKFLKNKAEKNNTNDPKLREYIAIDRKILKTAIKAQKHYLNHTILGRIEKIIDRFLSCFNVKSSLQMVEEQRNEIEGELETLGIIDSTDDEKPNIKSKSRALMARAIAYRDETHFFPIGKDESKPSSVFIAKPNGDVYEVPIDSVKAKGASHYYYEGKLHAMENGSAKPIGVISNLPPSKQFKETYSEIEQQLFSMSSQGMEKEFSLLQGLRHIHRVVRAYDYFSTTLLGTGIRTASFIMLKHHEHGDLHTFMKSLNAQQMSRESKLHFMMSLLKTYMDLHESNLIHRDVKTKNIVVRQDKAGAFIPTVIDVETCVSPNDASEKEKVASTMEFWPPEYIQAYIENPFDVSNATSKKMDTWSLGLVFFTFFYGQDLIGKLFGFSDCLDNCHPQHHPKILAKLLQDKLPEFIREMQPGNEARAEWAGIKKAIQQDPCIWNTIILPMLATKPKERPSIEELHAKLANHIDSQLVGDEDSLISAE